MYVLQDLQSLLWALQENCISNVKMQAAGAALELSGAGERPFPGQLQLYMGIFPETRTITVTNLHLLQRSRAYFKLVFHQNI